MKIRHKVPMARVRPVVLTPEYQAEVDRATNAGEKRYRDAQRRLANAEAKLAALNTRKHRPKPSEIATARALVELWRSQLETLERMMRTSPATASHRGTKSYRPAPPTRGSLL